MKIKKILYTTDFQKNSKKLPKNVREELIKRESTFRAEIFSPNLQTHKLKGKFKDYYSFSITYSYRVVFRFISEDTVLFVDCGDHRVYR